jgi:S-layer homology domain
MAVLLLAAKHGPGWVPPASTGTVFTDVPIDFWAGDFIEALAAEGITSGWVMGTSVLRAR